MKEAFFHTPKMQTTRLTCIATTLPSLSSQRRDSLQKCNARKSAQLSEHVHASKTSQWLSTPSRAPRASSRQRLPAPRAISHHRPSEITEAATNHWCRTRYSSIVHTVPIATTCYRSKKKVASFLLQACPVTSAKRKHRMMTAGPPIRPWARWSLTMMRGTWRAGWPLALKRLIRQTHPTVRSWKLMNLSISQKLSRQSLLSRWSCASSVTEASNWGRKLLQRRSSKLSKSQAFVKRIPHSIKNQSSRTFKMKSEKLSRRWHRRIRQLKAPKLKMTCSIDHSVIRGSLRQRLLLQMHTRRVRHQESWIDTRMSALQICESQLKTVWCKPWHRKDQGHL